MNSLSFNLMADEYIRAASDAQLSSSTSHLLATLLSEEDQHDYNQLLKTTLSQDILHIIHQVTFLFTFSNLSHLFISSSLHLFICSYLHFFYFHHQQHGQLLFFSKNSSFNSIPSIFSPSLLVSLSHLNINIHHHMTSTMNLLHLVVTSMIFNSFMYASHLSLSHSYVHS